MASPEKRTQKERVIEFERIRQYIINYMLGTEGAKDETWTDIATRVVEDAEEGTQLRTPEKPFSRQVLEENITIDRVAKMVYEWAYRLDVREREPYGGYAPGDNFARQIRYGSELDNIDRDFWVNYNASESIESAVDAVLTHAFQTAPSDAEYGEWRWAGIKKEKPTFVEDFVDSEEDTLIKFFLESGDTAHLTTPEQIGFFIDSISPILNPNNPDAIKIKFAIDPNFRNNVAAAWPKIKSSMMFEEVDTGTPSFERGIGKIIVDIMNPDSDYGWMGTLFGPTEELPRTPNFFMDERTYLGWRARENFRAEDDQSIIDDPMEAFKRMLPGDNELKMEYGTWAVTAKKAFIEKYTNRLLGLAGDIGAGIDPDTGDFKVAAGLMMNEMDGIRNHMTDGWLPFMAEAQANHYQDPTARTAIIKQVLFDRGYLPEDLSSSDLFTLNQQLALMGSEGAFRDYYSQERVDDLVATNKYLKFQEEYGSWDLVEGIVDDWLANSGGLEVSDARKHDMILELFQDMPSLEEFADSPENKYTLLEKL